MIKNGIEFSCNSYHLYIILFKEKEKKYKPMNYKYNSASDKPILKNIIKGNQIRGVDFKDIQSIQFHYQNEGQFFIF